LRIGVDLMGSDSSPKTLFDAVLEVSEQSEDSVSFVVLVTNESAVQLFGDPAAILLKSDSGAKIDLCFVDEFISMEDDPLSAVRQKKGSSLAKGIQLLKNEEIDAFVTAGNTGALIFYSTFHLAPLGEFDRPALLAVLPTKDTPLVMVDVGGNVSCKPHHLVQYAYIGAAYQRCTQKIEVPRIGLLNIGVESKKGTPEVRQAYQILKDKAMAPGSRISFVGNIEGREVFEGKVDVLATDGFTGNVLLKTSEGASSFIFAYLQDLLKDASSKDVQKILGGFHKHFNYEEHPGALVCGVDGIVIKCHGAASKKAMANSIWEAIILIESRFLEKIKAEL
jgi:glycerol-3-phosphate acyltransferase PlsX